MKDQWITDAAISIVDELVHRGFVPDCTDTDDETEFVIQDMIESKIKASMKYIRL